MNWTLIIAIAGCITGGISLFIQFRSHFLTIAKLNISIDQRNYSFFMKQIDSKYRSNFGATISLKISNPTSLPITIDEVKAGVDLKDTKFAFHRDDDYLKHVSIQTSNTSSVSFKQVAELHIPCRVEPFDTIYASVKLPFFDDLVNPNNQNESIEFKLFIRTPRKVFSIPVKIYEHKEVYRMCNSHEW